MRHPKPVRWAAVLTLAIALAPSAAPAQEPDTLSISGTFRMEGLEGTVGADLAGIFARGHDHWWRLTLHGVSYSHERFYEEWEDTAGPGYHERLITRVHATAFDLEFFGPDAGFLDEAVARQLVTGGLTGGAVLELVNGDYLDPYAFRNEPYTSWDLHLSPLDAASGVSFSAYSAHNWYFAPFAADDDGYPVAEPRRLTSDQTLIGDQRLGYSGALRSYQNIVDLGFSEQPIVPPTLEILDASAAEGHTGTSYLTLTVRRSGDSTVGVSVAYRTVAGTATATKDFSPTSGTLTFTPGQTTRTIAVAIKGDRQREPNETFTVRLSNAQREPNETFTVRLSNAAGAGIDDAVATATIVNDD